MVSEGLQLNELNELACLVIPTSGNNLLLPNVSVAEIVGYLHPIAPIDSPEWLLGMIDWRNQQVPLISFECLNGDSKPQMDVENRIVILNTTGISDELTWIGIVAKSTPHLVRVASDEINEGENEPLGSMELVSVSIYDEYAVIPDIDLIQKKYAEYCDKS